MWSENLTYGYGPIGSDESTALQKSFLANGASSVDGAGYPRMTNPDGAPGGYAFGNGYWAYAFNAQFADTDLLSQIVANAPKF
ncbi:hypothetical protein BH11ACT2_BH11ACT2_22170 [soil metagenome]